jgi:uncharacterized membrane protein
MRRRAHSVHRICQLEDTMATADATFVYVAAYPDETAAQTDYETATRHGAWWGIAAGAALGAIFPPSILGTAAAGGIIGGVSGHLAKGMSRDRVKELGDFIEPGQTGLIVVGESQVENAIQDAVTDAEKATAEELGVDPKDLDRALQEATKDM